MALTCDNCGKIIGEDEFVSWATDHTENKVGGCSADDWFYFHEGECAKAARMMLESLRRFSHEGDESGLRWELVSAEPVVEKTPVPPAPAKKALHAGAQGAWRKELRFVLDEPTAPPDNEVRERREKGIALNQILSHKPSWTALQANNLIVLEDIAELTEVEFLGMRGVGPTLVERIKGAMVLNSLVFREGPTRDQLGGALRTLREEHEGGSPHDLSDALAAKLGLEEKIHDTEGEERFSKAFSELRHSIRQAEGSQKPPSPGLLQLMAAHYGLEVEEILQRATDHVVLA